MSHFVFVAWENKLWFDTRTISKRLRSPAVGQEDIDLVTLVDLIDPGKIVVVGLVAGVLDGEAFSTSKEVAVVDNIFSLMAGESNHGELAEST